MGYNHKSEPIINAPTVVVVVLSVLTALHALRFWGPPLWDRELLTYLALYPYRLGPDGGDVPGGYIIGFTSLATHALLHGDWVHLVMNCAWLLAFGAMVARRTSAAGFLLLFVLCAVAGGLTYVAVNGFSQTIVVGVSGAVSGLMGCVFRLIFAARYAGGMGSLQRHPLEVPRMPLAMAFKHRETMIAFWIWIVMNLLLGLAGPNLFGGGGIAWEAHLGGFLAGFLFFGAFDRGRGWVWST